MEFQLVAIRVEEIEGRALGGVLFPLFRRLRDMISGDVECGVCTGQGNVGVVVTRRDVFFHTETEPEIADFEIGTFWPFSPECCTKRVSVEGNGFWQVGAGKRNVVYAL